MKQHWIDTAFFYHIYPLGLCGAPQHNQLYDPVEYRLEKIYSWLDHIQGLGANAIYLGPVFQSSHHGYDTIDYYQIDRRLGDIQAFSKLATAIHDRGMRLVLDAVFNHVGREFWAFKDVLEHGEDSHYCDWFYDLRFGEESPMGDPFQYEGWQGHYRLVKLNLANPDVRTHLFHAVQMWVDQFQIDGLRLDAADCLDFDFIKALKKYSKNLPPDFWLMGEVVHGDYRDWVNPDMLDSVTNYSGYKGLYSSLNDANYFEVSHNFDRQFGDQGLYQNLNLYNFVDNHDVNRVASQLKNPSHIFPLYILLATMPGIPSIYYGSEWGIHGRKGPWSDDSLRPALDLAQLESISPNPDLPGIIRQLADIRLASTALQVGKYQEVFVDHQQFAFLRTTPGESIIVALNSADDQQLINFTLPFEHGKLVDLLNPQQAFKVQNGSAEVSLSPTWGRILKWIG